MTMLAESAAAMAEPRVSFAVEADREAAVADAIAIFQREGVVVLDDLIDPALVAQCREEIEQAYPDMADRNVERNFGPDPGRHTVPMVIEGALAEPAIFAPKPVKRLAAAMLGDNYKVDSLGLLVSVPGAPDQRRHADAILFPRSGVDRLVEPFAIAFAVPLVTMDETSGRTAFWRRSHRTGTPTGDYDLAPVVKPGSAILWDYRIHHCGLANRGDRPRPVIFTALSREWWVEIDPPGGVNYRKLQVARDVYDAMTRRQQYRVSRARLVDANQTEPSC